DHHVSSSLDGNGLGPLRLERDRLVERAGSHDIHSGKASTFPLQCPPFRADSPLPAATNQPTSLSAVAACSPPSHASGWKGTWPSRTALSRGSARTRGGGVWAAAA